MGSTTISGRYGLLKQVTVLLISLQFITGVAQSAIITVDNSADIALPSNNGDCTLREAIKAAEDDTAVDGCTAGNGADTIRFASGISSITINAGDLSGASNSIRNSLSIEGPGVDTFEISGAGNRQLFYINSIDADQEFNFRDFSLIKGLGSNDGGAIFKAGQGTLNLTDMHFANNTATAGGGAVAIHRVTSGTSIFNVLRTTFENNNSLQNGGGAIRVSLNIQTSVTDSSFSNNSSTGSSSSGGAISVLVGFVSTSGSSQIDILRSTFRKNTADGDGGAISFTGTPGSPVTASIRHSTIVQNEADLNQDDAFNSNGGGINLRRLTDLSLANTIIADNIDHTGAGPVYDDIYLNNIAAPQNSTISSEGTNFIGANNTLTLSDFPSGNPNVNFDYVGTAGSKLSPNLESYADNGGPTKTLLPTAAGNLVDKGSCAAEPYDQRGFGNIDTQLRLVDISATANGSGSDGCDIGAVELSAELLLPTTNTESSTCFPIRTANGKAAIVCM